MMMMMSSMTTSVVFVLAIFLGFQYVASLEFDVGGPKGWVVPPSNDTNIYNIWASHNRFQVGDSIRFRYRKDSVMEVGEEDYKRCNSTHPTFFSNIGNTEFKFQHSGTFYFISGATGHCEKGQKMAIRVLVPDDHDKSHGHHDAVTPFAGVSGIIITLLFLPFVLACDAFGSYM
ncbi:hypothetical protein AAHE18_20G232800 [Arachis hypogaea]|uniref:Phytocyanin domain-containing protein n=3 Tax=Arachis TaxID=3817 RepID=A0A444X9L4_ARAHY|nr:Early nodulin-like protein [Arachis hypogaea]RYQ86354.1 hypothetical protein Ahy_B10g106023 [Arachis hypogaea]